MRPLHAALPFLILSTTLVTGCGGGGGGSNGGSSSGSSQYVLNDNVVQLDKTAAVVVSVTADTVVMTGAPTLSAGQVLIHNAADSTRFLRKVVSATVAGGTTTVTTTDAEAADVFKSASIDQTVELSAADLMKMQPADTGVTITAADGGGASDGFARRGSSTNKIALNFNGFQVKDGAGHVLASVSGTVTFGAGLQTVWKQQFLHPLPDEAGVVGLASASGKLTALAGASGTFSREVPVTFRAAIPVTPLGPLGITLGIQMMMKAEGSYTAGGQFVVTASVDAKAGVHYQYGSGWSTTNGFTKSFNFTPPQIQGTLDFGVSLIRPAISADILGLGEAHVTADALEAIAHIDGVTSPKPGFNIKGQGDFGFTVGGSLHIGPINLWSDERNFDLGRFDLTKTIFLPYNNGGSGGGGNTEPTIRF